MTEQPTLHATITRRPTGYEVAAVLDRHGDGRLVLEEAADSYEDAEEILHAFASQNEFPWYRATVIQQ